MRTLINATGSCQQPARRPCATHCRHDHWDRYLLLLSAAPNEGCLLGLIALAHPVSFFRSYWPLPTKKRACTKIPVPQRGKCSGFQPRIFVFEVVGDKSISDLYKRSYGKDIINMPRRRQHQNRRPSPRRKHPSQRRRRIHRLLRARTPTAIVLLLVRRRQRKRNPNVIRRRILNRKRIYGIPWMPRYTMLPCIVYPMIIGAIGKIVLIFSDDFLLRRFLFSLVACATGYSRRHSTHFGSTTHYRKPQQKY